MNPIAKTILELYQNEVDQKIPGFLEGLYLYGSLTLGDFHPKKSDIDFITVSSQRINNLQFQELRKIHKKIQRKYRKPNLNGIYLTWEDLGKTKEAIPAIPYFFQGKLHRAGHFEINPVTWWQLKNHAISLVGRPPENMDFEVDSYLLVDYIHENMHSYWADWVKTHSIWWSYKSWLLVIFPRLVEWGVLGLSRQYFTLKTHQIASKLEAGEYCLKNFPGEFKNILKEAIRIRKGKSGAIYPSAWLRYKETMDYMNYIIKECDRPVENFYHLF